MPLEELCNFAVAIVHSVSDTSTHTPDNEPSDSSPIPGTYNPETKSNSMCDDLHPKKNDVGSATLW